MNLTPLTAKAAAKIQPAEKEITNSVYGYLRRDALNAVQQAKEVISKPNEYFSPCTLIETPAAPKNCAQIIDFRF